MRASWLIAVGVGLMPVMGGAQTIHLEAETARLSGPDLRVMPTAVVAAPLSSPRPGVAVVPEVPVTAPVRFSGSGYITGFTDALDRAVFRATAKTGGLYRLSVAYRTSARRGYEVEVNGLHVSGMLPAAPGDGFAVETLGTVELITGENEIAIDKAWGFYDVDYIELKPVGLVMPVVRPTDAPSDAAVTSEARALLTRLDDSYGKTTLLGVYKDRDAKYVEEETGVRPALMGGDLLAWSPVFVAHGSHPEKDAEVERLIARAQEGYLITLSWHWGSPTGLLETEKEPWWKGFYTEGTQFDIAKVMADPTSSDYLLLQRDIDAIALQLRKLQEAHVPVLWRPLHEAEGGWFWWGAKGPKPFVQLWQMVYDRLTKVDGIHNLVWVYTSGGDPAWYPGDAYVDVVGIDAYPKDLRDPQSGLWGQLQTQLCGRKPLTISEFGGVPDVPRMQRMGEYWSYAVSWSDKEGPKKNEVEELRRIYRSGGAGTLPVIDGGHGASATPRDLESPGDKPRIF